MERLKPDLEKAFTCFSRGDFPHALEHFEGYLEENPEIPTSNKADIVSHIGNCYLLLGAHVRAMEHFEQHMILCEQCRDPERKFLGRENFGNALFSLGRYQEAYAQFEANLDYAEKQDNLDYIYRTLINLGCLCAAWQDLPGAKNFFNRLLLLAKNNQHDENQAFALARLGNIFRQEGLLLEAKNYLNWSLKLYQNTQNLAELPELFLDLIHVYKDLGEPEEARARAGAAKEIFLLVENEALKKDFQTLLSELEQNGSTH